MSYGIIKSSNPWKSITDTGESGISSNPIKGSDATGAMDATRPFSFCAIDYRKD